MKILITFFSGTGNTYYCAKYLKNHLEKTAEKVMVCSIEHLSKEEIPDFDLLVAGFPVYACDMPAVMRDYLIKIPLTARKIAYLFCTKGFYSGNALKKAADALKTAGYRICGSADVTMPGSDGLIFLKKGSFAAKKMCSRDFTFIEPLDWMIAEIESDIKRIKRSEEMELERPVRVKIKGILADGFTKIAHHPMTNWMEKKFYADNTCVRCGYCEKICPAHNISITDSGISFEGHCYLCVRCINQCPKAAIQMGKGTVGKMRWKGPDDDFDPLNQDGN